MDRPENGLNALEAKLGSLRPAASGLDRDRLMFLAGKASAASEMRGRVLSASVAGLALVVVGLGGWVVRERGERVRLEAALAAVERGAREERVEKVISPATPAPNSYLALMQRPEEFVGGDPSPTVSLGAPPNPGPADREPPLSPMSARAREWMEF